MNEKITRDGAIEPHLVYSLVEENHYTDQLVESS